MCIYKPVMVGPDKPAITGQSCVLHVLSQTTQHISTLADAHICVCTCMYVCPFFNTGSGMRLHCRRPLVFSLMSCNCQQMLQEACQSTASLWSPLSSSSSTSPCLASSHPTLSQNTCTLPHTPTIGQFREQASSSYIGLYTNMYIVAVRGPYMPVWALQLICWKLPKGLIHAQ